MDGTVIPQVLGERVEAMSTAQRTLVLLAGGRGTRLAAVAGDRPKALQPVAGTPVIDHLVKAADGLGFGSLHLALGFGHERVVEHLRSRGIRFTWSLDDLPGGSGTAGALRSARSHLPESFGVWLADTLPPPSLLRTVLPFPEGHDLARMVVSGSVPDVTHNVTVRGERVLAYAKSGNTTATHVDAGLYTMRRELLDLIPGGRSDLEQVWPVLCDRDQLAALPLPGRFLDIGTPGRLAGAEQALGEDDDRCLR